jgi:hypothetical protein
MTQSLFPRIRRLRVFTLAAIALCLGLAGTPAGALPVVDDVLEAATCSGLLDGLADTLDGELGALIDPSACHQESDAVVCAPEGATCTTAVEEGTPDGTVSVKVTGVASPGGAMFLAVSRTAQTHACGKPLYVRSSIRFESEGVSDLVATHRISKPLDQATAQNGAENVGICYQSPKPFTDSTGAVTTYGLLPGCDATSGAPPCISHRKKNKADALVEMKLPSGDPTWKMVEDIVEERLG